MEEASFKLNRGRCVCQTDWMGKDLGQRNSLNKEHQDPLAPLSAVGGSIRLENQESGWSTVKDKSGERQSRSHKGCWDQVGSVHFALNVKIWGVIEGF